MRREIRAEYDQMHLLPPALEDWVGADHPAHFIREFVEGVDLVGMGFGERRGEEGRPNYSAGLLLKVWLYGYMWGIWSTRKLERGCREMMGLIWLTGMQAPDHNTLWRFWRDNREALRKVFRAGVLVAARGEMTRVGSTLPSSSMMSRATAALVQREASWTLSAASQAGMEGTSWECIGAGDSASVRFACSAAAIGRGGR